MSKTIPVTLLAHKASSSTTLCKLKKIGPLNDGSYRPLASLDEDVVYDDGTGPLTYKARTGFQSSVISSTADLGVDNAETETLVSLESFELEGFTQAQIDSGLLDKVPFVEYEVNYRDLTMGHEVVKGGTIGEVRMKVGGIAILEDRSLSQQLKQSIGDLDSLTCRAKHGSQIGDPGVRANKVCGFVLEWVSGTVLAVGAETDLIFTDTGLDQADDYFAPGVVEWLTGNNAGQQCEVDAFASGVVTLQFPTVSPILLGDTYRIRRECSKLWTGHNSCETFWDTEKALHFRGEPWIPVADTGNLNSPGVAISRIGLAGTGEGGTVTPSVPTDEEPAGGGDLGGITSGLTRTRGATVISVTTHGAVGDGVTDDTAAFQAAIDALPGDGGTVTVPDGTYLINSVTSVDLVDNMLLSLSSGAILKAKTNTTNSDFILSVIGVSNVEIAGGLIRGDLDTFVPQSGTTSEHGHGVVFQGASACTLRDITIEKCVGDGVYCGSLSGQPDTSDIKIDNVVITNCRRNGVSVTARADAVEITNSEISYVGTVQGTSPKYGIDIEPNSSTGYFATNTLIDGCNIHHNANGGIQVRRNGNDTTISNNTITNNGYGIYTVGAVGGTITGNTISHHTNTAIHMSDVTDDFAISDNTMFDNKKGSAADTTTGTTTSRTGTSTATSKHISISSDCTDITVGTNDYGP